MIVNTKISIASNAVVTLQTEEKLSIKASNSLPEFVREEFPTFQQFIEYYYEFLSQSKNGYTQISSIKDIDEIGEKYLTEFYKVFATNMPVFPYMGMADFIRNAKQFYVSRGSEDSFRFLFRIMFGEEIEFKYPKENLFIGSSGKWTQRVSLYVDISSGVANSTLIGKKLTVKAFDGSTSTLLVKGVTPKTGNEVWDDSELWNDSSTWGDTYTFYEVDVEKFVGQDIKEGSNVYGLKDPLTLAYSLQGKIRQTLNSFEVITPGENFTLGEIFTFGEMSFRVTAVDQNKGIKRIEFLSFGDITDTPITQTFRTATIKFIPSPVNRYSGFYENTDGFLSNNSKLHDGYFYQLFSYVIKSKVSKDLYEDLTTRILHPAGLMMFGEYEQSSINNLGITSSILTNVDLSPIDVLPIYDSVSIAGSFYRAFQDTLLLTDSTSFKVGKYQTDTIAVSDSGSINYWEAGTYTDTGYGTDELYSSNSQITYSI